MGKRTNENLNEPTSSSQNGEILQYLRDGETITSLESLLLFRCFRCASRISDLRNELSHLISDVTISVKSKDKNGKVVCKHVSAYYMPEAFAKKHSIGADVDVAESAKSYATAKAQRAFNSYYGE